MLEISNNSLKNKVNLKRFSSFKRLDDTERFKIFSRLLKGFSIFILVMLLCCFFHGPKTFGAKGR